MALSAPFITPFYEGGVASSSEVPGLFPVGLAGHSYLVDLLSNQFRRRTIPLIRQQADSRDSPGEHSINPEDLWRRAPEDWSHGAGQVYFDRPDSDPSRFRTSKGIDVWSRWQASLLPATGQKVSSANTNLYLASAGARLYATDGTAVSYTTDITGASPTFTAVTSTPGVAATSITSDGFNVWTSHTASGIYSTNTGTGAAASYTSGTVTLVRYVKGRLMAAAANSVYNIIVGGGAVLPTALLTHANTGFTWVDMAEGRTHIYMAGFAGDKSLVYSTTIKPDGTALDVPAVAGELPDGEIVRAIQGYLGYILIGSDKGLRFAAPDSSGKLTLGALIPTTSAVGCFEPQDRFAWYALTNYDATSTGLGRIDLSVFTQPLTPAYASDLMATGQGAVQSVATFQSIRVFGVSGLGIYAETTDKVASGTIDSGLITYGIPDQKMGVFLDLRHTPLAGTVAISIAADGGAFESVGSSTIASSSGTSVTAGQQLGQVFEIRLTLTRSGSATTTGPTVTRATLRSYPIPTRGEVLQVPLVLHESLAVNGQVRPLDLRSEFGFIKGLLDNQTLVSFQFGEEALSVFVEDYEWQPSSQTQDGSFWNGLLVVRLKSVVE